MTAGWSERKACSDCFVPFRQHESTMVVVVLSIQAKKNSVGLLRRMLSQTETVLIQFTGPEYINVDAILCPVSCAQQDGFS